MTDKISNELKTPLNILNTNTAQDFNVSIDTKSTQDKKVEVAKTARWPYGKEQIDALNRIISDIETALESKNTPALQEIASGEKLYTITKAEFNIGDFGGNNTRKIKLATLTASLEGENKKNPLDIGVKEANALLVRIDNLRKAANKALSTSTSSIMKEANTSAAVAAAQKNISQLLGLDDAELTKYVKNTTKLDNTNLSVIIYAAKTAGVDVTAIETRVENLEKKVHEEGVRTVLDQVLKATPTDKNDIDNMEVKVTKDKIEASVPLKEFVAKTQTDQTLKTSEPFLALQSKIEAIKTADRESKQVQLNGSVGLRIAGPFDKEYQWKNNIKKDVFSADNVRTGTRTDKQYYYFSQELSENVQLNGGFTKKINSTAKLGVNFGINTFNYKGRKITEGTPTTTINATSTTPEKIITGDKYTEYASTSQKGIAYGASLSYGTDVIKVATYVEALSRKEFIIDKNTGKPQLRTDGTENYNVADRKSIGAFLDLNTNITEKNMHGTGESALSLYARGQYDHTFANLEKYNVVTDQKKASVAAEESFIRGHVVGTYKFRETISDADFKNGKRSAFSVYGLTAFQQNMAKGNASNDIDKNALGVENYAGTGSFRVVLGAGATYDHYRKLDNGKYKNDFSIRGSYNLAHRNAPIQVMFPFGYSLLPGFGLDLVYKF